MFHFSLQNPSIKIEPPSFEELNVNDAILAEKLLSSSYEECFDDDDEILICKNQIIPAPIASPAYEVKQNDIVSGNMPFATDVSIYIINWKSKFF